MHVIFALPRSRTAWLSRFLTYRHWTCGHEDLRHMHDLDDIRSYLSRPHHGTIETAAAPGWRLLKAFAPKARVIVIRRPVGEVVDSLMAITGVAFDRPLLTNVIEQHDRKLDQIEARLPCLSVSFDDLRGEKTCKAVFEHCLPYAHDRDHWHRFNEQNIQINVSQLLREPRETARSLAALAAMAADFTKMNGGNTPWR